MRVLHSRGSGHPICDLGVGSSLLNSSILLLFRQPLTSPIIVFTSSATSLLVQTHLQSIWWPWKAIFFLSIGPPATRHFFPLAVVIAKSMLSVNYVSVMMWIFYIDWQQYWKCDWTMNTGANRNTHAKRTVSTKQPQVTDLTVGLPDIGEVLS